MTVTSGASTEPEVPIGTAVVGTTARVLDARLVPCPDGEVGEIYLAGGALARGYLDRPELTAERFVADPHGEPGSRMYRTGDLGSWDHGVLHYRGRVDDQVKIRGFRVEPGETAACVEAVDGVREAHVFAAGTAGDAILVAAVATDTVATATLHRILADRLPEYLRPAHILRYPKLPRTTVGKLDLAALRADLARTRTGTDDVPAADLALDAPTARVTALMTEVLQRPITADDSFFAHGGHSLSALRLLTELERAFGATVSLRTLFDAPTPRELARHLDTAEQPQPRTAPPPIPVVDDRPGPAQERMLLSHELVGGPAYTIALHWRLEAENLDAATVERAWRLLIERHTALRTRYPRRDGDLRSEVLPADAVPVRILATGADEPARTENLIDVARAAAEEPFDPTRDAPLRIFVATGPRSTDIAILVHHVATDEHGLELLQREFLATVAALRDGLAPPLSPPPLTSAQFAAIQRRREHDHGAAQLREWTEVLAGHLGSGELPADAHGTGVGAGTVDHPVPGVSAAALASAAQRLRLTPFMLFHAAVALTLQRADAGDDLVLASPVAGREADGAESMVDCATNTVPIRHRDIAAGTLADLAQRSRNAVLDALERTTVSYDVVQRELGGTALSDVLVGVYQTPRAAVEHDDLRCTSRPLTATRAKVALAPTLVIDADTATVFVEHDTAVFTTARARGIASAIATLVAELATRPHDTPVPALTLVTADERAQLLGAWGGESHDLPCETFGEHFLRAADRHADKPALTVGDVTLDYAQLSRRARRLAARLRALGVDTEDVVAVATDRGVDMVVAHIAVLLSGGTFLAIDPATPADRVATLLRRLPPKLVVTSGCDLALPADAPPPLRLDHDPTPDDHPEPPPPPRIRIDALAYVIFTSGTTGEPKPVGVGHRGVSKLIATQRARLGRAEGRRVLSYATPTFDASFWQLCGTLCDGGELVVMPDACRLPGPAFVDFVTEQAIDVVSVPPSVLGALPNDARLPDRVQLIIGAERLSQTLVDRWGGRHLLHNAYGPSEATVNTTLHHCRPAEAGPVPIGRVDPGARGYVVDTAFGLCPVGFPGELVIGGEGVARGYLGDPVKTATAFVADPFAPGHRCYRSGDRVVRRADGALEFLGRTDDQIKLRGFRIEPGEIVSVLERLPRVRQAAVVVRTGPSGQPRLVGYVVTEPRSFDESATRDRLRRRLPAHLVPDRLCPVAAIPRLASGKIDRDALPEPAARATRDATPASAEARRLCRAFAEALGLDEVHPDDDFFALGGSSLTAATLLRGLGPVAGRRLTFPDLFAAPTPRLLAAAGGGTDPLAVRLELRPAPAEGALPGVWLLPPLAGMSWCYTGLRNWIDPRRALIGLQSPNLAEPERTPRDFAELVRLWADVIAESNPRPAHLVGWSFGGASALAVAAELQRRGLPTGLVAMLDSYPKAEWADQAPTPAQSTRSALRMLGVDLSLDEAERLDARQAARLMAEANPLLAGLESFDPQRMIDNFTAGPALERSARFDGYRGDLLVFTAQRTAAAMISDWRAWREFVSGSVRSIPVDAAHQDMVADAALSVIGPRLDRALRESE